MVYNLNITDRRDITVEDGLLNRIMSDENYGKGLIPLPAGTVVPEGKVVYFSFSDQRCGGGMMQGTIVYICKRELVRTGDNKYYYSYYLKNEGKETSERYQIPEETVKVFNRLIGNTCLAGCGNLKHDYLPGFMSPFNTPDTVYNMTLDLEEESGEIIRIPLSSCDISSNGGGDIITALFTLLDSIRNEQDLVPGQQEQSIWKCMCGCETNTGNFCIRCGARRS